MWTKQRLEIENAYEDLVSGGYIDPKQTTKDQYLYEAWHNWSRPTPNEYHKNFRDDATMLINSIALIILANSGLNSFSARRINELTREMMR